MEGRQIVVIHGGTSFDTQADYLDFIKTRAVDIERLRGADDWRGALAGELGEEFEVLLPKMPNPTNARYTEWRIWLERCEPFIQDDAVFIGHSLGGIFLAKYLAENRWPKKVRATLLVAAPFDGCSTPESLADFALPESLAKLAAHGGEVYLVHSKDDPVVPYGEAVKYQQALPQARRLTFSDKGHFNQASFPELAALIRLL